MIKDIVKDEKFLTKQSERFVFGEDEHIIKDLIDTANAHKDNCVGLAAVQIGYHKRVIVVRMNDDFIPFINPRIVQKFGNQYTAFEGCLSVESGGYAKRKSGVRVAYTGENGKEKIITYTGYTAQIIQHEVDHLNGVLI